MAESLLDIINRNLQEPAQPEFQEQAPGIRQLLRAKTGREITERGPAGTSLLEQQAAAQTRAGLSQLGQQQQLVAAQQAGQQAEITQRAQQQQVETAERFKATQDQADRESFNILSDFQRGQKQLTNAQDIADLERVGFNLRLKNEQYINALQTAGEKARLDNDKQFKEQVYKQMFQDQTSLLTDDLARRTLIEADDREFVQALQNIDLDYAMQIANDAARAASTQQIVGGVGTLVTGFAQAFSKDR